MRTITINANHKNIKRPAALAGILAAITVFIISLLILQQRLDIKSSKKHFFLKEKSDALNASFDLFFTRLYSDLAWLSRTISENGKVEGFETTAAEITSNNTSINTIILSQGAVIRYVYPGSQKNILLNQNLFDIANNDEKKRLTATIKSKRIMLAGPFENPFHDSVIVARMPVYVKGSFWGFSSISVKFKELLQMMGLTTQDSKVYDFHISYISMNDKKERFFFNGPPDKTETYLSEPVADINWKLYIAQKKESKSFVLIVMLFSLLGSVLTGIMVKRFFEKSFRLQSLIHEKEKRILEAEFQFKTIFENAPIGIAIIDHNTSHITVANRKFWDMTGYKKEQLLSGITIADLVPPDIYKETVTELPGIWKKKKSKIIKDLCFTNKHGATTWMHVTVFPLSSAENNIDRKYVILGEDITDKRAAEQKVRESDQRYQLLFNESPVALWEEDFSGTVALLRKNGLMGKTEEEVAAYFDQQAATLWDYIKLVKLTAFNDACVKQHKAISKEDLSANFLKYIGTEQSVTVIKKILTAICTGKHKFESESTFNNAAGAVGNSILSWRVIPGHEEHYDQVILTTVDITDLKRSKTELEAAQARLQSLVDNIDGIVWTADPHTLKYNFISKKIFEITGYKVHERLDTSLMSLTRAHPDDRAAVIRKIEHSLTYGTYCEVEYHAQLKDGTSKWFRESIDFIKDGNNTIQSIIGIIVDITDLHTSRTELQQSLEIMHHQNKRLMDFSYIVSHNLRAHTSNIQSLCDLILTSNSCDEKEKLSNSLYQVANMLSKTMDGLSEIITIDKSNLLLKKQDINLKQEVDNTISVLKDKIDAQNAIVINNVPEERNIFFNKAYIESILLNLISNAIKYSQPGRLPIVTINYHAENNENMLEITDNGIGIDLVKNKDKLFGLFNTFTSNPDSKGMGLYITKRHIEAMNGTIIADSTPGQGTTFKIYFK
ncbi:MAG: PAS domain S-box protein [Niabella sp.]